MDAFFGLDHPNTPGDQVELLTTVHDNAELSVLRSILDSEEIPYFLRDRGCGGAVRVIAGYTMFGTDVFVPKERFEEAHDLLEAYRNAEPVEEDETGDGGEAET